MSSTASSEQQILECVSLSNDTESEQNNDTESELIGNVNKAILEIDECKCESVTDLKLPKSTDTRCSSSEKKDNQKSANSQEERDNLTSLVMDNCSTDGVKTEKSKATVSSKQKTVTVTSLQEMANRVNEIPEFLPMERVQQRNKVTNDRNSTVIDPDISSVPVMSSIVERSTEGTVDDLDDDDELCINSVEEPSDELAEQIVVQVQFYFSNENILKDAFLLKHVRRNKEGFVSLKLISSFKRVRQLTKDWRVVGAAINKITASGSGGVGIELNEAGSKVRRITPLPVFDETMPSRTVVASHFAESITVASMKRMTIEAMSDVFGKCGEIALIRILRPGSNIPTDVRQFYNKHPELHERECALIEFTESTAARQALQITSMQMYEMVAPKKKTGKKTIQASNVQATGGNVRAIVENYKYNGFADAERSRGGDGAGDYKHHSFRRGSAGYFMKYNDQQSHGPMVCQYHNQRRTSFGSSIPNGDNIGSGGVDGFTRRLSNCSSIGSGGDMIRKFSNCSTTDFFCSDMPRRASLRSQDVSRRPSQCSLGGGDLIVPPSYAPRRRDSQQCVDIQCPCARQSTTYHRVSGPADPLTPYYAELVNVGQQREYQKRYNTGGRRVSFDDVGAFADRKQLTAGYCVDGMRKISGNDKVHDIRKMSADSGYDRRSSLGSVASENRYMVSPGAMPDGSTAINTKSDAFVRSPIGPDGSKGFSSRIRKVGQVVRPL